MKIGKDTAGYLAAVSHLMGEKQTASAFETVHAINNKKARKKKKKREHDSSTDANEAPPVRHSYYE